jgi:ABC-type polysaccharide/polyol phosphate transport system ATPase subunit
MVGERLGTVGPGAMSDTARLEETAAPPRLAAAAGVAAGSAAVSVRGVSKTFRVPHEQVRTLKQRALHPFRTARFNDLQALDDVSFEIAEGEFLSIIGRNGSGKSTLLKCLTGVYQPEAGTMLIRGRVSPFIELGVGFNPELSAYDNVLVNATLNGLRPAEARRRFDSIIAYAELEDFVDMKLKNYSTGMAMRLAFATAIQVDADVLLVDEVLAVGDALFQRKCIETFQRLKGEGRTIVFVSHSPSIIRVLSDRAMLLDGGRVVTIGDPESVLLTYQQRNRDRQLEVDRARPVEHLGDGSAEILDAWFEDAGGARILALPHGERVSFKLRTTFHRDIDPVSFGFAILDENQTLVSNVDDHWHGFPAGRVEAGETVTFVTSFTNLLSRGLYYVTPYVTHADYSWADVIERHLVVEVEAPVQTGGLVDLPHEVEVIRE